MYIERCALSADVDKIVFVEQAVYQTYFKEHTSDIYLMGFEYPNFSVVSDNPVKDTLQYMQIMCNKTEWLRMASEMCDDYQLVWVDFGIFHLIRDREELHRGLKHIAEKSYPVVRIPGCWNPVDVFGNMNLHTVL
jgi:hypothetical protein